MKLYEKDIALVQNYLIENGDKTITEVYYQIKSKKLRHRSKAEILVFTYLHMNK